MSTPPEDQHEWVSFDDPHEVRTWVFDVTFLLSNWTCIFGRGCPGVLTGPAPELIQGCCSYGAHFTGEADVERVAEASATMTAKEWQFRSTAKRRGDIVDRNDDGTITTKMVRGACIFLNRPGWPTGAGCSLHQAALARAKRPLDTKPDVCWQLPLRLVESVDDAGHPSATLREWKRRDWGEGGDEFHWWCTDDPDAFIGSQAVYVEMADEIIEMVGPGIYNELVRYLQQRGTERFLPHPAVRRPPRQ